MGKRVDFSARTVVSPDPNLALDQLGVPRSVALSLTFPELVTPLNIDRLTELVKNGPAEWPGAKSITRKDGISFDLRFVKNRDDIQLNYGFIVERHIVDGDYVVFNRQPTLHRMSMMGHRIKILPYSSFRLNLSVTTPYNADFDGDEMNMHVPQSHETRSEIKNIMHVERQIISPQANKPVMGIVQDSLLGIRLFTRRNVFLRREQVMQLLICVDDFDGILPKPAILKPVELWTGKQIVSVIFPKVNLERRTNTASDLDDKQCSLRDGKVLIEKGELLTGMLDKGIVGSAAGGLIHIVWLDFGPAMAGKLLSNIQYIVNNWLVSYGFSVGISDIFCDEETKETVQKDLLQADSVVSDLLALAEKKKLDHQPGKQMIDSFEANVNSHLNRIFDEASRKAQSMMNDRNNIYNMVAAGSKGSNLNIAQIMACLGQQNVEGKRIPFGFLKRTLPHFTKDDYSSDARGFVKSSYLTGLEPHEFFFHAMGGREGLIDTAVKTSETGYLQRRLVKCLEDLMVKYDSTVRDCSGNIIQFLYGEDGMSGEFIEGLVQNFTILKDEDFQRQFRFFDPNHINKSIVEQLQGFSHFLAPDVLEDLVSNIDSLEILEHEYQRLYDLRNELRRSTDTKIYLPVNIGRILKNLKTLKKNELDTEKLDPIVVIKKVDALIERLIIVPGKDQVSKDAQNSGVYLLQGVLRFFLSSKRIIVFEKFTPSLFEELLGEIETKFLMARAQAGEMVGVITAQSLGEPTTQMTLNTFHFAGVSAKNVTLGVPRLKEILNVAKNIKTPSMQIYLQKVNALETGESEAKRLQSILEYTTLGHLTNKVEIYFDPDPLTTVIDEDKEMVDLYRIMADEEDYENQSLRSSSWLLRFELNKNALIDRHIERLEEISNKIKEDFKNEVMVICNPDIIPENPVIRIRLRGVKNADGFETIPPKAQIETLQAIQQRLLEDLRLKGVMNIKRVYLKKHKGKQFDNQGAIIDTTEWMLETDGSALKTLLTIPGILMQKTSTNNLIEIYDILGIEAARLSIIKEIKMVLEVYGIYVNFRHLITLADIMTQRGKLSSVSRTGLNQVIDGPFRKASFEQTVEILYQAGAFSEEQSFKGITENIMFGQLAPVGTGSFKLMMNLQDLLDPKYQPDLSLVNAPEPLLDTMNNYGIGTPDHMNTPLPGPGNTPGASIRNIRGSFTPGGQIYTPTHTPGMTPIGEGHSPYIGFSANSPGIGYRAFSPVYNPVQSPTYKQMLSPKYSVGSNLIGQSPMSPSYNLASASPSYSPGSLHQSINAYSPASPSYQNFLSSPRYTQASPVNQLSPNSPQYALSSGSLGSGNKHYSPSSPAYDIAVKNYSPASPAYYIKANNDNTIKEGLYSDEEDIEEEKNNQHMK